ncbi:MAG: ATPase, T2SS/T4P/T4SS family [Ferrimicrobium sp.]
MATLPDRISSTSTTPSALSALAERDNVEYELWSEREKFDARMRERLSADVLTRSGLWINLDEYFGNPQSRLSADRVRTNLGSFLFGDFAKRYKEEIQSELSRISSSGTVQELEFLRSFVARTKATTDDLLKSKAFGGEVARSAGFYAQLLLLRIYSELFDLGIYMAYTFTEEVSNIHIIGTRMLCYRSNGQCWFALVPASKSPQDMISLASHYARSVNKRFDRGFAHNNLDTTRQYRVAVRQATPQFDEFIGVIRLHQHVNPSPGDMVTYGYLSYEAFNFVNRCVSAALPGLITGSPGSGKTTFLRAMTMAIPRTSPIFSVEHAPELFLNALTDANGLPWFTTLHTHIVQGQNAEGSGGIPFPEIFQWGLQEDVVRFIVGEIADAQSMLTFINALQTGQSGALATLHANSVKDTISRVSSLLAETYPREIAWEYLGQNLRFIVHAQKVITPTQERRFVTGIGWVHYDTETIGRYDAPPLVHDVFVRDFRSGALERGAGFTEGMRQLMAAEDRAFGHNLGAELPTDYLLAF